MNETENNGVLTYTTESRGFNYQSGDYQLAGNKVTNEGVLISVDGGNIQKNGEYIGSYYLRGNGDALRVTISEVPVGELSNVNDIISDLIAALNNE